MLIEKFKELKYAKNSNYYDLKYKFNYHSNKIEGSTFSLEDGLEYRSVLAKHDVKELYEFFNHCEQYEL